MAVEFCLSFWFLQSPQNQPDPLWAFFSILNIIINMKDDLILLLWNLGYFVFMESFPDHSVKSGVYVMIIPMLLMMYIDLNLTSEA